MKTTRHFTVTIYIVYKNKVLLHLHKKMNCWLPIGGHIEENELPEVAALREVKEEAGLPINFYEPKKKVNMGKTVKELLYPMHIQLQDIKPGHKHIDFAFFATTKVNKFKPEEGEATELRWFTLDEVKKLKNAPVNAIKLAQEALKLLAK